MCEGGSHSGFHLHLHQDWGCLTAYCACWPLVRGECSIQVCFTILVACLFFHEVYKFFIYCGQQTPNRYIMCTCFLPFCGLIFHFLGSSFWCICVFNFEEANWSVFLLLLVRRVNSKTIANPRSWKCISMFCLIVYTFTSYVEALHLFWVNFCMWSEVRVQFHFSSCAWPVAQHHLLERPFFTQCQAVCPLSKINGLRW